MLFEQFTFQLHVIYLYFVSGPSQLIAEGYSGKATPQAPVYATIRPSPSQQKGPPSSSSRSSLNSLPAAVNSNDDILRFHPTNPFYTTLPSNYSRLPVPNSRMSISSLDKSKCGEIQDSIYNCKTESVAPKYNVKVFPSRHTSLPYSIYNNVENTNGHKSTEPKPLIPDKKDYSFYHNKTDELRNQKLPNHNKNSFETKRNSDPFEKYLRSQYEINGKHESDNKKIPNSMSDSNFRSKEEITERSIITEQEINEVEEIKTIKKIVRNGYGHSTDSLRKLNHKSSTALDKNKVDEFNCQQFKPSKDSLEVDKTKQLFPNSTLRRSNYFRSLFDKEREEIYTPSTKTYQSLQETHKNQFGK